MLISDIENAIITRLQDKVTDLIVETFPNNPDDYIEYEFVHPIGAVLVYYAGSGYSNTKSISSIVQDELAKFGMTIMIRNLDLKKGCYKYLDQVKNALTGYKIDGCKKMYPLKSELLSEKDGIWQYGITFAISKPSTEEEDESDELPKFTGLTLEN